MIESTLEEWKQRARESDHVRAHETVVFNEGQDGVISATIPHPNTSIFIGSYFTGLGGSTMTMTRSVNG